MLMLSITPNGKKCSPPVGEAAGQWGGLMNKFDQIPMRCVDTYTRGVQKVLQVDIQKIHKALVFDFI